ncbi:MAG: TFIIB-type zinc ribbon-containing protein [Candidatus Nitrosopelagicus sp.]|jgi:transcription initiation factor TFIIB|nr:TFIIB-type zinc ribbon-containing protein [Candidatus Nitrosopelagicus sp.]
MKSFKTQNAESLTSKLPNLERCPACNKSSLVLDQTSGELLCSICGIVISENRESVDPEWRSFANDAGADKSRVGSGTSITMHDMGLSTMIGTANKDATGKPLSSTMKKSIDRLRTWNARSQVKSSSDKNLRQALSEMDKLKDKLSLTDAVIEKAAYIYRKANEKKLVKGRSIHGLVASCIYAACRDAQTPRTLDDVADGINVRRKDVARCYRLIFRELDLKIPIADPVNGISRIASEAGLGEKTKRKAITLLNKAKKFGMVAGKDPMGLAAAALYLACISDGGNTTQRNISDASGVTEVTIRNRCVGLRPLL